MFKNYRGLWALLLVAFAIFAIVSAFDNPITIAGHELKSSKIAQTLTAAPDTADAAHAALGKADEQNGSPYGSGATPRSVSEASAYEGSATHPAKPVETDTAALTLLFIGDSMLDGLSPRLAAYAKENGHTLYSVVWYSSTSEAWGKSGKLAKYISDLHPDFVFICLGSNELFVKDIKEKRQKYVKQMLAELGNTPYLWIGPPNWKPDTGINDMLQSTLRPGGYFVSNGMHFERRKDGAHPTPASAIVWMDSVARWMPRNSFHPIKMDAPQERTARPKRVFIHQPSEIQ